MALTDEMRKQIAKDAGVKDPFAKGDKLAAAILGEMAALGLTGGLVGAGGKLVYRGIKGARAIAAARKAIAAAKKAKQTSSKTGRAPVKAERKPVKAERKSVQTERKSVQTERKPVKAERKPIKTKRQSTLSSQQASSKTKSGLTSKGKKLVGAAAGVAAAGATGLGITASQLRSMRSEDASSKKKKRQLTPEEKRGLRSTSKAKRKSVVGVGEDGPDKTKPKAKPKAKYQPANARKASSNYQPANAPKAKKERPKRPKADQSIPRGGKVTAKRISKSMKDRGRAFQGSYDPKTEVLKNVTINGKKKTMVFKKK